MVFSYFGVIDLMGEWVNERYQRTKSKIMAMLFDTSTSHEYEDDNINITTVSK